MVRRRGTKWAKVIEHALQRGPGTASEIQKRLGPAVLAMQVRRGIEALEERGAVKLDVVRLGNEKIGKARYVLRTPETALDELEKDKKLIEGEYSFIRVPEEVFSLVAASFGDKWDLKPWFKVANNDVKEDQLTPAERVGYHLAEARYAFHTLVRDLVKKRVLGRLSEKERDLFEEFGGEGRLLEGPAGWEEMAPPPPGREKKERLAAARRVASRVRADIQIEVEELEEETATLEVLGGAISFSGGGASMIGDVLFHESVRQTLRNQSNEQFNESARAFFSVYYEVVTDNPEARESYLAPYLIHPAGQEKFLDLVGKWGIDSSQADLPVNLERPFISAANVALREINKRRQDLDSHLKPILDKALEARRSYAEFEASKTRQIWGFHG